MLIRDAIAKGFTLIEILVVILIISIATSIIVLNAGNFYLSDKHADVLAREMGALIKLARIQAIYSTTTVGLEISNGAYRFLQLDNINNTWVWKALGEQDQFWSDRKIPESIIVQVEVAQDANNNLYQQGSSAPQIIFFPSGELTPFKLTLHKQGSSQIYVISGTYAGNIQVTMQ
jgi:general secretion pathway protein H